MNENINETPDTVSPAGRAAPAERMLVRMLEALVAFVRRMNLASAMSVGEFLGFLAFHIMRHKNRIGMKNLDLVYGDRISRREKRAILRGMWVNFGRNLIEFLRIPDYGPHNIGRFVTWTGFEHLAAAKRRGKGALVLTAHYGNWDLVALASGIKGIPIAMITKKLENQFWNEFWMRHRRGSGEYVFPIWKKGAAKGIFRALKDNTFVAYVLDQDAKPKDGSIFVEFFGLNASTTNALAVLSEKRGLPVIPGFMVRVSRTKHHAIILPPIEFERVGTVEESIKHNTRRYLEVVERFIQEHPDHWIWIHRRWKRRPEGEPGIY
jgi:KDO2-lipid IV(A) lauroyltransferase